MNPIDKKLSKKYEANGGGIKGRLKTLGQGVMSTAEGINKMTGGQKLSQYFGEKIAKRFTKPENKKYVSQTVSGKDALKSAGKVVLSAATVSGIGGAASGAAKGITTAASKAKDISSAVKSIASRAKVASSPKIDSIKRVLAKHKSGGDTKMLNSLKKADHKVGQKLTVKSTGEKSTSFNRLNIDKKAGEYSKLEMRPARETAKLKILKNKLNPSKDGRPLSERNSWRTNLRRDYPESFKQTAGKRPKARRGATRPEPR